MSKFLTNKVLPLAFLVIALAISLLIIEFKQNPRGPQPENITVDGTLICLPHKSNPATAECTLGIRTFEKKNYGIQFVEDPINLNWDAPYRVTGSLTSIDQNVYDSLGTIIVDTIQQLAD